jgi:dephospho-CoA kinase
MRPCTVGLTGGLASGKSTVANLLRRRGVPVVDADAVVRRLYRRGEAGAERVKELFGDAVLTSAGAVDRAALRALVLADPDARERLNAVVHPLVRSQIQDWLAAVAEPVAVIEAALLVETGAYRQYDVLLVVWCPPHEQLERAVARGLAEESAAALLAAQAPLADKLAVADVRIDNGGRPEDLESELERAWSEVVELCREGAAGRRAPGVPNQQASAGSSHSVS